MRHDPLKDENYVVFLKSLIVVLCFVIFVFYFFPDVSFRQSHQRVIPEEPFITIENLPPPTQQKRPSAPRSKIQFPSYFIPIAAETEDLPESLSVNISKNPGKVENVSPILREIPPRPVLEIYPDTKQFRCKGEIQLYILIDVNGKVIEVEVLKNTTQNPACLQQTLKAVYKTRWLPGSRNGNQEAMWVKKTFRFQ